MATTAAGAHGERGTRAAGTVQSVDRALQVLECLGESGTAGSTEIAQQLGVHKSTVSRILTSLEARGFVEQTDTWGKYRLGLALARLAGRAAAGADLGRAGHEVCSALAEELGETTNIAVLDRDRAVNIAEGIAPSEIALRSWVGQGSPAHATASGKALLLTVPRGELVGRLGRRLETFTPRTLAHTRDLAGELDLMRDRGWTSVEEELELGLNAVAAPVWDHQGQVVAALSLSGPAYRLPAGRFEEVAAAVREAAERVTLRMGGRPDALTSR